ncbi:MAG: FimV/HubP family polar landmark protein [Succinivibrio sp.]|nr:FimV/HubP family polar landmark protein [Succinivibrio sp.]
MHGLKKFSLTIVLSALLSVSAHAVDEDGTFTITIQGPEEEQIQQVAPRQTAPRRANVAINVQRRQPTRTVDATNNPNRQARTTPRVATTTQSNTTTTTVAKTSNIPNFANDRRYEVKAGDTIWSVAHRYLPQDRSFNEFQIVASIYRHNPKAFANNNVNALQKTTLVIPDDKLMALESAQIGSALLSRGTLQMPALDYSSLTKTDTPKVETTTTVTTTTTPTTTETKVAKKAETPKSEDETLPVYEATETKIKRLQEEEAKKELSQLTPNDDPNAQNENKNAKNKELIDLTNSSTAVDVKAINLMLDENKKMVESKLRVLENQLAEALERMKKSSAATAKTATDSVATLAGQYDNIIAKIQQDLIEIKGNINRLSQDNDRLREMLLANDEKIEDMQLQLSQFSITVPESSVDLNKPVMMILFGAGLLALVMIVLFIIFKAKYRSNQRVLTDDFDVDDGSYDSDDTSLLSDENGSVEIETPTGEEYEDETEPNKEEPKKEEAQDNKDNKDNKEETAKTEESPVETDTSTPKEEDSVQKAWDEAANTKAEEPKADKAVLDEWSQALDEQEQQENKQVDVSRDDESVADAWADALKEQNKAENNTEEAKSASSSLDDDMSAWTEAFKEQEESQDHELPPGEASVSTEQKDMADAWAKALEEQEKEAKEAQVSDAVETPVEDEKVKENSADIPEAQTTLEDQTSEPASDTQSTQEAEIAKAMANSSAPSVDVAEAEASKVESQETLDHDYLQEHDQDAVKVEDVNEDELLNQISGNVDDALKQADETEETATTNTVASPDDRTLEPSKEDVVAEDSKDESKALAEDDIANATLSGEEKALLDSLAKHQEQVAQDETVDAEFETDNAAQTAPEKEQDSDSHKVDPKLGTKVDEVLNDDLDLEDILAQNNDSEVIDAVPEEVPVSDENAEVASAIEDTEATPQDNEVTAEPQVEEAVIDEPVAVAEPEPKTNEKASTQDVAEDTVAEEPTATEIDANTDDLVQDNLDKSSNSDEKTSEQGVVSWAVPNDDYDVVQAHKEQAQAQAQAEGTTTQLQDDTVAEETVTEPSDTLDQNENEEEPSETIVEDENVAANVNTDADTEVVEPQEEVVTTEPVETKVEEIKTEPQANADDTQAEALDTQTVDSEAVADVNTADESSADDLRELEIRLGASRADYDPGADQDLMNMLGGSNEEPALDEHHDLQGDVGSMLSDEIAKAASKSELETVDPQNEVLEQVFDKIGPISAIDPSEESDTITSEADTTLDNEQQNSKEYQYYVDELNLARLYFETGDTEEAIKIIDDVKENATDDLKEEAIKIMQSYGN